MRIDSDGEVVIAEIDDDNITYIVKYMNTLEGEYYRLVCIDDYIDETNVSTYVSLDSLYKAVIKSFYPRVSESLIKQCNYFDSDEGRRLLELIPEKIKSPTPEVTVCEVTDVDEKNIIVKMTPHGWQLITLSEAGGNISNYHNPKAVFINLRGNCTNAAYNALVSQYKQLKDRLEFEPDTL